MNYNDHQFVAKASHLDGGVRLWSGMERDGTSMPFIRHKKMITVKKLKYLGAIV